MFNNYTNSSSFQNKGQMRSRKIVRVGFFFALAGFALIVTSKVTGQQPTLSRMQLAAVVDELVSIHGDSERERIAKGVGQVTRFWREDDGNADEFARFCREHYLADPEMRQKTADRLEAALASINGHMRETSRDLDWHLDVATGPLLPIDHLTARLSPSAHVTEDLFRTKIAFVVLLNFPLYNLEERLRDGSTWTRDQWAQARLAERFAARVPPEVSQKISDTRTTAGSYISNYNIFMHHLLTADGERLFPEGLRLISHWNLRDELKSQYAEPDGLRRQEMIYDLMLRIIRQEVPASVINNPAVDWEMSSNEVVLSPVIDGDIPAGWTMTGEPGQTVGNDPEPDTRYENLLSMFHAQSELDKYYQHMPTLMDRRFQRDREIPEAEVEQILKSVLTSETVIRIGQLIEMRLDRELRPFDIWYDGFKARGSIPEEELNRIVREKYPSAEVFEADLQNILNKLGFDNATAEFLISRVAVDPSRGIGHAMAPGRRVDKAHLRTRIAKSGMDYKGYNIAIHEFGHNIEQVFSLNRVDHTLLRGVPNTAFTEGFAFVFQARDLELLGLTNDDPMAKNLQALDDLWSTYEIAGVSLVDMSVWNWMYDHPEATPAELKKAVIAIARGVWNDYFAPVFGVRDVALLAVYSHMISGAMYLPDYPLGQIIAFQIEEYLKEGNLAREMERMCSLGSITPGLWMHEAVGNPISAEPMLQAAEEALSELGY